MGSRLPGQRLDLRAIAFEQLVPFPVDRTTHPVLDMCHMFKTASVLTCLGLSNPRDSRMSIWPSGP